MYDKIISVITNNDNFIITSHVSPDGDAIGSTLGLYNFLTSMGKNVSVVLADEPPKKFNYLPGYQSILRCSDITKDVFEGISYVFSLDSGDLDRIGDVNDFINSKIVNIDHHISNNSFGYINLVEPTASSVGELIYELIKSTDYKISKEIAECLYTSILTDTGGFKYSNTTPKTLSIVSDLIATGIDFSGIYNRAISIKTKTQLKLLSKVLETLDITHDDKVSIISLSREILDSCNAIDEDSEDFINIARDIDTVEVAVFIKEKEDGTCRVSLRSKSLADVRKIAEVFDGGGHIRAAGCTIKGSINQVKLALMNEIEKVIF